jgi:DNA mismatch repair ATPase MutS
MVLVTTHDVELQPLLNDCSRLFHFSEQVDGNRYYFDYILRDGPCRAGNAIKLIELKGFPPNLVEEARRLAAIK